MFSSHLKIKPNSDPPAGKATAPTDDRAGKPQAKNYDGNFQDANSNHTRGAIGTLAAIAILMWFVSFFLLAGPGVGVSDNSAANPALRSTVNVSANSH